MKDRDLQIVQGGLALFGVESAPLRATARPVRDKAAASSVSRRWPCVNCSIARSVLALLLVNMGEPGMGQERVFPEPDGFL